MHPKLVSNQINPHFSLHESLINVGLYFGLYKQNKDSVSDTIDQFLCTKNYKLLTTARSGLTLLIQTLQIPKDKTIAIPAYCCGVIAAPFITAGYTITWIDTDMQGLISFDDFATKTKSHNIGLVLVPHIFGQLAPTQQIYTYAKQHNMIVVEDCAHALTTGFDYCDYRIVSFGREKILSTVSGGALLWSGDSPHAQKLKDTQLPAPSQQYIAQHILQPLIYSLALPWWHSGGKILPFIAKKIGILPLAVSPAERNAHTSTDIYRMPDTQQHMLARQIQAHNAKHTHAKAIAKHWVKTLNQLFPEGNLTVPKSAFRVIMTHPNATQILEKATQCGYHLYEWNGCPIAPAGTNLSTFGYHAGQCSNAEAVATTLITFPTNQRTNMADIARFQTLFSA